MRTRPLRDTQGPCSAPWVDSPPPGSPPGCTHRPCSHPPVPAEQAHSDSRAVPLQASFSTPKVQTSPCQEPPPCLASLSEASWGRGVFEDPTRPGDATLCPSLTSGRSQIPSPVSQLAKWATDSAAPQLTCPQSRRAPKSLHLCHQTAMSPGLTLPPLGALGTCPQVPRPSGPSWSEPGGSPLLGQPHPPLSPAVCFPAHGLDKSWELE